jgi:short-subunit dehydrogenase
MTAGALLDYPPPSRGIARGGSALVTGASSGIGEAFARALAARAVSLLLTGLPSDTERLESIGEDLSRTHGIRCLTVPMDLSRPDGPEQLRAAADESEFEPDLIVNSAGFGVAGRFADAQMDEQLRMISVNVAAVVDLTGLYLPRMMARRSGAVINVISTAAFQPVPYFSVYAATKAFILSFGESLWAESRRAGVSIVNVCSGPVDTPFHGDGSAPASQGPVRRFLRRRYLTPERVVESALTAVDRDRPIVVLRIPVVGMLSYPLALVRAIVPIRSRLLLSERLNRWLFEQR